MDIDDTNYNIVYKWPSFSLSETQRFSLDLTYGLPVLNLTALYYSLVQWIFSKKYNFIGHWHDDVAQFYKASDEGECMDCDCRLSKLNLFKLKMS